MPDALLFMGTGNNDTFMNKIKKILRKYKWEVDIKRWNTGAKLSVNYLDLSQWNVQKGTFDIIAGHSAGCFPASLSTSAQYKIGFNGFILTYPFMDWVFHAKDDWLVIQDDPLIQPKRDVIIYDGKHSTAPTKEFEKWLKKTYGY